MKQRPLTPAEIAALPPGLVRAVPVAEVRLLGRHHPVSWAAMLIGRGPQIVVRGRHIFWPHLRADISDSPLHMSLLAHELVHVWQYATGMTLVSYVLRDIIGRLGRYDYSLVPGQLYTSYGYEQQAAMVEDWMRLKARHAARHGQDGVDIAALEAVVPFLAGT